MSPATEKTWNPNTWNSGADETRLPESADQPVNTTSSPAEIVTQSPDEDLEDKEHNPWRNHEDDQHKWLGLLLAAVGFGAIGYLIGGV